MDGRRSRLDPALFVWRKRGKIIDIMVTHVVDFCFGGRRRIPSRHHRMKENLKIDEE